MSARSRRRRGNEKPPTLNLVSLMDIFTILVFFLMVNGSDSQVLDANSEIELPDSITEQNPEERVAIAVSADEVLVEGRKVAEVASALASETGIIAGLAEELNYRATRRLSRSANPAEWQGKVTIMADKDLPYDLLKRVMYTCQQSRFNQIALAVNKVAGES